MVLSTIDLQEGLQEDPILASILLMALDLLFLISPIFIIRPPPGEEGWLIYVPTYYFVTFLFMAALWFWLVPQGLQLPKNKSLKSYLWRIGFRKSGARGISFGRAILLGVSCTLTVIFCLFLASFISGGFQPDLINLFPPMSWSLISSLIPGIWEEVAFRGVILTLLLTRYKKEQAVYLDALLYSSIHIANIIILVEGITLTDQIAQLIYTFLLGIVFAVLYIETENLIPCIIMHYSIDALLPLFPFSASITPLMDMLLQIFIALGVLPTILCLSILWFSIKKWKGRKLLAPDKELIL